MGLVDRLRAALGRPEPAEATETSGSMAPGRYRTHTLLPGEDLAAVAAAHGVTEAEIVELNRLADPALLYPGQVLRLPHH